MLKNKFNNEQGIVGLLVVILLILGVILGVYLVQTRTNLLPKAFESVSGPVVVPTIDSDHDGFSDNDEIFYGTNPNRACPLNDKDDAWPPDTSNNGSVNGTDVSKLVPYISGGKDYNRRYDLNKDGVIYGEIGPDNKATGDLKPIQDFMLKSCDEDFLPPTTPPVATQSARLSIVKNITPNNIGQEDYFEIYVSSPIDLINLVSARLNFTSDKFEVTSIEINNAVFNQTVDKFFDNSKGTIWIVTGIEKNGVKDSGSNPIKVATVKFRVKGNGIGTASFTDQSKVIRASDTTNIFSFINSPPYTISNTTITPPVIPPSCSPKPVLEKEEVMTPQGLRVTIKATTNNSTPTNRVKSLNFYRFENATVTIGTQNYTAPFTYPTPSTDNSVTFYLTQIAAGRSTFVELKAYDICSEQSLFVGRDASAGWPTGNPPTATSSATPRPTQTPAPQACKLTKAEWVASANPANSNTTVGLRVEATGSCENQPVNFTILEDDGAVLGTDPVKHNPKSVILVANPSQANFVTKTTWTTEFQEDGLFGSGNPPEYKFIAKLNLGDSIVSSDPELQVLPEVGKPTPIEGDLNINGEIELGDMSWLLRHWGPINNELFDYKKDKEINNLDRSYLISILQQHGALRPE